MFAATATGLLRFSEWQSRVTVKHKLAFSRVRIRKSLSDNNAVRALSLGFDLQSAAEFPLQFEIKRLETQFANQYPPKKDYEQPVIMLRPNQEGWFNDHFISLEKVDLKGKTAEGTISAQIRYGRPDNLTQEFEIKKRIYIRFSAEGNIEATEWHDI